MPFRIAQESRTITKKIGDQSLTLTYSMHKYSAARQSRFEDDFGAIDKLCGKCGAKLILEEMTQSDREARTKKVGSNGHAMLERSVMCEACGERANTRQAQARMMADWLADNLTEADWEDDKGQIPITTEAIFERLPYEIMMTAFTMVGEDKAGKK